MTKRRMMELQERLGVTQDNLFGVVTATALAEHMTNGKIAYDDPDVQYCRTLSKGNAPHGKFMQGTLIAKMMDDPRGPRGKLLWADSGEWKLKNLRNITIPGVGKRTVYSRSAPAYVCAFGEVEARLPGFLKGRKVETLCTRRMNWNLKSLPSLHSFGIAFDIDLDKDGRCERVEDMDADTRLFVEIMESWGFRWLRNDHMHFQYSSV